MNGGFFLSLSCSQMLTKNSCSCTHTHTHALYVDRKPADCRGAARRRVGDSHADHCRSGRVCWLSQCLLRRSLFLRGLLLFCFFYFRVGINSYFAFLVGPNGFWFSFGFFVGFFFVVLSRSQNAHQTTVSFADGLSRKESQEVSRIVYEAGNDVLANLNVRFAAS